MGAEEKDEERGASESSGLDDIMELGAAFGADEDEDPSSDIVSSDGTDDDLDGLASGFGGVAAASLVGEDAPIEAANEAIAPVEPKTKAPPSAPPPSASVKAKVPAPAPEESVAGRSVSTSEADASAAAALVASAPSASQIAAASTVAAAPPRDKPGGAMAMWLIVAGIIALLGVGYFAFMYGKDDKDKVVEREPPKVASSAPVEEPPKVEAKAPPPPEPEPEPAADTDEEEEIEVEEEPEEEVEADVKTKRRNKGKRHKKGGDDAGETPEETPKEVEVPKEKKPVPQLTEDQYRTECLLNPNKPGCAEAKQRWGDKYKDLDKALPEKLNESDVRSGIRPQRSKAKACGAKFGVEPGTTVRVKLSIAGDTGKVSSADAIGPHAGTPVGKCVADALQGARFRRFKSETQGTTYPVTM